MYNEYQLLQTVYQSMFFWKMLWFLKITTTWITSVLFLQSILILILQSNLWEKHKIWNERLSTNANKFKVENKSSYTCCPHLLVPSLIPPKWLKKNKETLNVKTCIYYCFQECFKVSIYSFESSHVNYTFVCLTRYTVPWSFCFHLMMNSEVFITWEFKSRWQEIVIKNSYMKTIHFPKKKHIMEFLSASW